MHALIKKQSPVIFGYYNLKYSNDYFLYFLHQEKASIFDEISPCFKQGHNELLHLQFTNFRNKYSSETKLQTFLKKLCC
jgi:hypothetical protein